MTPNTSYALGRSPEPGRSIEVGRLGRDGARLLAATPPLSQKSYLVLRAEFRAE